VEDFRYHPPPMKRATFPTAQDAEAAFYEALERADLEAMMAVWAEDEEIVCIHPGGPRLTGYEQVRESWAQMFKARPRLQVHLSNQVYVQGMMLSIHSVHENIAVAGEPKARPPMVATNVYLRTGSGWRLLVHHASPVPAAAPPPAADGPKVLH
jgi:ketosteroid isomerase-like protein